MSWHDIFAMCLLSLFHSFVHFHRAKFLFSCKIFVCFMCHIKYLSMKFNPFGEGSKKIRRQYKHRFDTRYTCVSSRHMNKCVPFERSRAELFNLGGDGHSSVSPSRRCRSLQSILDFRKCYTLTYLRYIT